MHIPHSRPSFGTPFIAAATKVIDSGFLAQGQETQALEYLIQGQLSNHHIVAVDSGTSALMLAIRHLTQNKAGTRIGIPSFACASLLFAVKAANATPVFIDCNTNLCLDKEQTLTLANTLDVLVIVHPFGMVDPLVQENIPCPVIEDIAQSVGGVLENQAVGTFADISIGSLYATKPWGGAYGGFVCCKDEDTQQAITLMCNPDHTNLTSAYAGHHQLSNIHAALASIRIEHAAQESQQRLCWTDKYNALIEETTAETIQHMPGNYFRYLIRTQQNADDVISKFQNLDIDASRPIQQPLHHFDSKTECPYAEYAWNHCISLPLLANMTEDEFAHMQHGISQCL